MFGHEAVSKSPTGLLIGTKHNYVGLFGPIQTSSFTSAESKENEENLLPSLICIRF